MADFDDELIEDVVIKKRHKLDTIRILMQTKTIEIITLVEYLNETNEVIRTEQGKNYIYRNYINEEEEEVNDFNTFFQKLGLTNANLKQAIIEMEQ